MVHPAVVRQMPSCEIQHSKNSFLSHCAPPLGYSETPSGHSETSCELQTSTLRISRALHEGNPAQHARRYLLIVCETVRYKKDWHCLKSQALSVCGRTPRMFQPNTGYFCWACHQSICAAVPGR
ncbi:unnamed protein product [Nesidiocoris tenuis]|uniref:Uncharacterized protein n=1 Tax=Nesidiocoris tenuis TaxID=355587 RepID=A0A6H5GSK2_9HEMI|nr:unnamed protein product [Nesidiocoris tenuis]